MSSITDFDSLRHAMGENSEQPEGPARNARAEHLLLEAEKLNIPLAVIEALGHQLKVYNYSSEKGKMFVPFARLLRMWDERPEDFDAYETHSLHWVFKWMSAGMLDQPHIPLTSVEKWLGEMERRYRLAGHSERAVRSAEFSVAAHVGDMPRAERAYAAWLAADRDTMADCHACELHGQGWWQAQNGRDAEALELWRPVLEGEFTCAHEPHTVLASSLLSLLRLDRVDEARAHHLRGFRLVRPMESMRGAYADHVEFCALSGNEARALELLAERPAYFTDEGHPRSKLDFLSVVTLLMDRLTGLGLGGSQVPGPAGRTWTAAELAPHARARALALAARFDERNGTEYVSERARARMARRPLVDRLPLGVRPSGASLVPPPGGPVRPVAPGAGMSAAAGPEPSGDSAPPTLPALLVEARRMSDTLQPHAVEAWAAVARAAHEAEAAGNDAALAARDRAEVADHEAMALGPEATDLFERAAELYAEAGDPGEALAARARAAYVHALAGRVDEALTAVAGPHEEILALYAAGGTGLRQTASVLTARARILTRRMRAAGEDREDAVLEEAVTAVRAVLTFVEGHTGEDVRLAARAAEAQAMLGELAGLSGDVEGAAELSARAAEAFVAAGLPWFAVEYEARLAQLAHHLGDVDGAERALRATLEHGGPYLEPAGRAQLHLQLAEVTGGRGRVAQAADHALEAAHWADEAGEGATLGAWARHQLGGFLLQRGRWAEAAEVLESVLPDVTADTHGEGAVVQTLWWLGDCLGELGEHRSAAERRLQAAEIARHWPEQQDHATLAHLAAASLEQAGLSEEAERAFARAGELWRTVGDVPGLVRSLRARAWLLLRAEAGPDGARALMADAVEECGAAVAAAPDDGTRVHLTAELGHTYRQFADLLVRAADGGTADDDGRALLEEAVATLDRAIAVFAPLGPDAIEDRSRAELAAARLEADLGRPAAATARARAVLTAHGKAPEGDEAAQTLRARAEHLLSTVTEKKETRTEGKQERAKD
ncbi:tetratricopeptide repeat protein [Streptomyces sp. KMM 9044]|uniref:tetratricopeptide repeat protein n=1 Tax=Streptomyces sp. KMM 9044 TaxID=2744474 RepID=UPI002150D1A0|nr:tetratricopeptide repeat protein [Streptomyces sp. KMM 9044]WAX77730.1 tetratricopeptide repeat protein [Streptomyces sp. KMM 9044]